MAIYTRYGTQVTIVGKSDLEGWTIISYDDGSTREVGIMDLKADNGLVEINEAIAELTIADCKIALHTHSVYFTDIYACKFSPAIAQIEKYGTVEYILRELTELGFEATGEQDYMDDLPYSLIQITKLPTKG